MLGNILTYLQKLVAADKAPLIAAALAGIGLLAAKFGFHMNASDVSYLGAALTFLAGIFTHMHFAAKAAPKP
jgi:hypothetical protein